MVGSGNLGRRIGKVCMSIPMKNNTEQFIDSKIVRRRAQKRVVVAGGAGFLGSHLCKLLIEEGHRVDCVDNLLTGRVENIKPLIGHPNFSFIEHDIIDRLELDGSVSEIYNLACPASPPLYQADPLHTFKTCVFGSINLLELAQEKKAKILLSSTSEVYGDPFESPQKESYFGNVNPVGPRSCYDEGKRAAETCFYDYRNSRNIDTKIVRIFNTYGPNMRMDDGRVVSNFIVQALTDADLTVYGTGDQTRSFCFVDDMVDGLLRMMATPRSIAGPVNLGNPSEFTMNELAEMVLGKTSSASGTAYKPKPQDDPQQRRPDISQAAAELNWKPLTGFEEGLDRTIEYFARELQLLEKVSKEVA